MPIPTFTVAGTVANGIGAVVPALPLGWLSDDVGIMLVENQDATGIAAITGWTVVTSQFASTGNPTRLTVLWRRLKTGDTAPTVPDPGDHVVARILGFRDCVTTGSPINIFAGSTELVADTTVSIPGATTTAPNCTVIAAVSTGAVVASTAHIGTWVNASLTSVTEVADNWVADGGGGGFGAAIGVKTAAGAYSATTATVVTANFKALISLALTGTPTPRRRSLSSSFAR